MLVNQFVTYVCELDLHLLTARLRAPCIELEAIRKKQRSRKELFYERSGVYFSTGVDGHNR